jgi:large subunit ribosomal protein L41
MRQLTPFVTVKIDPVQGRFLGDPKGAFSGEAYLARWKKENGED